MVDKMPRLDDGALYNISEAARILGVSRETLRTYVKISALEIEGGSTAGRPLLSGRTLMEFWKSNSFGYESE